MASYEELIEWNIIVHEYVLFKGRNVNEIRPETKFRVTSLAFNLTTVLIQFVRQLIIIYVTMINMTFEKYRMIHLIVNSCVGTLLENVNEKQNSKTIFIHTRFWLLDDKLDINRNSQINS